MKKSYSHNVSHYFVLCVLMLSLPFTATAFDGITDQDQFSIKSRTIYFDRDYQKDSSDDSTLAEGIELNYQSGYIANFVSLGTSFYLVQNINSTGSAQNNILPEGSDDDGIDNHISKIGQLFADFQVTRNGHVKLGAQKVKTMLLRSSSTRAIPNTFRGITADYSFDQFKFYGYAFDEWSPRHDDSWDKFTTELGEEIDIVWGLGATYKKAGFKAELEYLVSQDYLAKLGIRAGYSWKLPSSKVQLSAGYFTAKDNGDLFKPGAEKDLDGNEDLDGSAYYVDLNWNVGMFTLGAAYTQVFDMWLEDNFAGDHGTNPFPTRAPIGPDFTNTEEKAWQARVGFDLSNFVPGLTTKVSYTRGTDAENSLTGKAGGTADEDYLAVDTRWKIPYLKGLSCRWYFADYDSDEKGKIGGVKGDETDHRVYLDYVVKF